MHDEEMMQSALRMRRGSSWALQGVSDGGGLSESGRAPKEIETALSMLRCKESINLVSSFEIKEEILQYIPIDNQREWTTLMLQTYNSTGVTGSMTCILPDSLSGRRHRRFTNPGGQNLLLDPCLFILRVLPIYRRGR